MSEAAQATSELLLKPYSFEAKKHGEQRGHIKKHSSNQVELLPKAGNKRQRKCPFGMCPAWWKENLSIHCAQLSQRCGTAGLRDGGWRQSRGNGSKQGEEAGRKG